MEPKVETVTVAVTRSEKEKLAMLADEMDARVSAIIHAAISKALADDYGIADWDKSASESGTGSKSTGYSGHFYMVALSPDLKAGRIKMGHTSNLETRMMKHKNTCPTAKILFTFPCKRFCEYPAILAITNNTKSEHLSREVWDFDDPVKAVQLAAQFFKMITGGQKRTTDIP